MTFFQVCELFLIYPVMFLNFWTVFDDLTLVDDVDAINNSHLGMVGMQAIKIWWFQGWFVALALPHCILQYILQMKISMATFLSPVSDDSTEEDLSNRWFFRGIIMNNPFKWRATTAMQLFPSWLTKWLGPFVFFRWLVVLPHSWNDMGIWYMTHF